MSEKEPRYRWPSRSLRHIRRFGRAPEGRTPDTRGNFRSSLAIMLIASALLAVFASRELRLFARDLPGNRVSDTIVRAADGWHRTMENSGLAGLNPALRRTFQRLRDGQW